MNNNIERITKQIAEQCKNIISAVCKGNKTKDNILYDSRIKKLISLLNRRPLKKIRVSQDVLNYCLENNILVFDYFILDKKELEQKYKKFYTNNYVVIDHNITDTAVLIKMINLYKNNYNANVLLYKDILNEQSCDLITINEYNNINNAGFALTGTKEQRDCCCSKKIEILDLWLTPINVINKFFDITKLNKSECMDSCACDDRWLNGNGYSIDILPMTKNVIQKDFLTITKNDVPKNIKTIIGNLPFSLLNKFVTKALELVGDCYFLVNGDTIFKHFPDNIEHIYIFSGLEGNQKDNRSRCEFDVPFLIKSALWCCIVHITKENQKQWTIEKNIDNVTKKDGYHIALGKNVFIKSDVLVSENKRITKIPVTSSIDYKGGKKIIKPNGGGIIDLKNFNIIDMNNM